MSDSFRRFTSKSDTQCAGSALVIVLWVIGALSMFIGSMAFEAHIEARITSYYRKRHKAVNLAQSGVEVAKLLMAKSAEIEPFSEAAPPEDDSWYSDAKSLAEGNDLSAVYPLGEGEIRLRIVTEQARRNVNLLQKEEEWEPVLAVGDVPEYLWPELIESFLDWTDRDDEARSDGAETDDFYSSLEKPYKARNGALYTVAELVRIKGFTPSIVYGGALEGEEASEEEPVVMSGIADLLTTYGDKKINVNAASKRVLMTLPDPEGIADLVADTIVEEREGVEDAEGNREPAYFRDDAELIDLVPELGGRARKDYVTTKSSKFYRITSVGAVHGVERTVDCIVESDRLGLRVLKWEEKE